MKQKLLFFSLIIELTVILFLGLDIHTKQRGKMDASISPIAKKNITFVQDKLQYFFEPLPGSGSITFEVPQWLTYEPVYTINSDALNDGSEYQIEKPKDTYRIITLGDSFTFGLYVNTHDNYSETLEHFLNSTSCKDTSKFEVINLGVPSYDIQYSAERFKKRGVKYDPDLVIWFVQQGTFSKMQELISQRVQQGDEIKDSKAAARAGEDIVREIGEENIVEYQSSFLADFGSIYKKELLMYTLTNQLWGKPEKNVENLVRKHPAWHFYKSLLNLREDDALFPDYHPNEKGHLLIAQDLYEYLRSSKIVSCDYGHHTMKPHLKVTINE